jgi:hypothetical protein
MRHEFTDHEWAAFKPTLPNKARGVPRGTTAVSYTASFGSCDPAHRGAICRRRLALYYLLQWVRSLASVWRMEPHHERTGCCL